MRISMAPTFVDALARLDPVSVKRTAGFLDKIVSEPRRTGFRLETLRDAPDAKVRSARVSGDLRAIVREDGDEVLLLFVGRHDAAYDWARRHRVAKGADGRALRVLEAGSPEPSAPPAALAETTDAERWACALSDDGGLCQPLAHGRFDA